MRGKPAELAHLLNYTDADVVLCETKLDQSVNTAEFLPKHYCSMARKDWNNSGGGVMIALKTKFVAEEIEMTEKGGELVWAKITLANHHPMYIGSFYNNDGSTTNVEHLDHSLDQISDLTKNNPNALIAVGGDFNAGGVEWEKHIVTSECRDKNSCTALIDTFNKFSLSQLQRSPTREDAVLDLFATNKPGLIKSCKDIPGISDHNAVIIDADIKAQTSMKLPQKVYQWKQADWATMREEATAFSKTFPSASADRSVAENYDQIEKLIKSMLRHVPTKMSRTRIDLPWLSQALKRKCKAKQRLCNRAKKIWQARAPQTL